MLTETETQAIFQAFEFAKALLEHGNTGKDIFAHAYKAMRLAGDSHDMATLVANMVENLVLNASEGFFGEGYDA